MSRMALVRTRRFVPLDARLVMVALAASLLAAACGSPSAIYLKDPSGKLVFKLPPSWTVFDQMQVYRDQHPGATFQAAQSATAGQWLVGFDGSAAPSIRDLLSPTATKPTGFSKVRPVTSTEQATLATTAGLRNAVFSLDQEQKQSPDLVRIQESHLQRLSGGYRALRITFSIEASASGPAMTFSQVAAVDSGIQHLYLLLIGCADDCYRENRTSINQVLDSWTLKEF
jgi:hypothetical protein